MTAPEPSGYKLANGYSAAHTVYESHRAAWAKKAYQGNLAETISILMQVLHEVSGKPKGIIVKVSEMLSPSVSLTYSSLTESQ
jgi:hypothetical protein